MGVHTTKETIEKELLSRGFEKRNIPSIKAFAHRHGKLDGMDINSLSVFKRANGSNYFVFLAIDREYGALHILFYNPAEPSLSRKFDRGDILRKHSIYPSSDDNSFIEKCLHEISVFSELKKHTDFFLWTHNHAGYVEQGGKLLSLIDMEKGAIRGANGPLDDGMSDSFDIMMSAALFCGDFYAITSHNHFNSQLFGELDSFGKELGIVAVPGVEITMPPYAYLPEDVEFLKRQVREELKSRGESINNTLLPSPYFYYGYSEESVAKFISSFANLESVKNARLPRLINGPHITVLFSTAKIAEEVQATLLAKRDVLYPPFSSPGIELWKTLATLKNKYGHNVLVIVAHPFCSEHLPAVGIADRAKIGQIQLKVIDDLIHRGWIDGIAAYNPSLNEDNNIFQGRELERAIADKGFEDMLRRDIDRASKETLTAIRHMTKAEFGIETFHTNAMNIALASHYHDYYVSRNIYVPRIGEPDTHWYGNFSITEPKLNHLARAVTVIRGEQEHIISSLFQAFMDYKRRSTPEIDYYAYVSLDNEGRIVPMKGREPTDKEKQESIHANSYFYGLKGFFGTMLPDFLEEIKDKGLSYVGEIFKRFRSY
ncbi:MAG: hypothetical protein D6769_03805 [Methanobacteriota archaeon]|nr:MAG: hypothetical protein D6769_03805 [Euryarchaeota archaeon]